MNLVPMPDGTTSVPPDVTTLVFDFAATVAGEPVIWTIARPGAIALDEREAGWLDQSVGEAVLTIEQVGLAAVAACCSPAPSTTSPAWSPSPSSGSSPSADRSFDGSNGDPMGARNEPVTRTVPDRWLDR